MNNQMMIEIVKAYIFHRTAQEVEIKQPQNFMESLKLTSAYQTAKSWFDENGSIELR